MHRVDLILLLFLPGVLVQHEESLQLVIQLAAALHKRWIIVLSQPTDPPINKMVRFLSRTNLYFTVLSWDELSHVQDAHTALVVLGLGSRSHVQVHYSPKFTWLLLSREQLEEVGVIPYDAEVYTSVDHEDVTLAKVFRVFRVSRESALMLKHVATYTDNSVKLERNWISLNHENPGERVRVIAFKPEGSGSGSTRVPEYSPGIWTAVSQRLNFTSVWTNDTTKYDYDCNLSHFDPRGVILPVVLSIRINLYYKEIPSALAMNTFLQPFSTLIWCLLVVMLLICVVFTCATQHKFTCLRSTSSLSDKERSGGTCSSFTFDAVSILLQQGIADCDKKTAFSTTIVVSTQLIFSLFLYYSYSAVFISFIAVTEPHIPFTTLEGILADGRYGILGLPHKSYDLYKYSRPGILRDLLNHNVLPEADQPETFPEAFQRVCRSKRPLLTESAVALTAENIRDSGYPCPISKHSVPLIQLKMTYKMSHDSSYKHVIKICMTKLLESGAIGAIYMKKAAMKKDLTTVLPPDSISLDEVLSLFGICLVGVIASLLLLLLEHIASILRRRNM